MLSISFHSTFNIQHSTFNIPRSPSKSLQIKAPPVIKDNSLRLQQMPLQLPPIRSAPRADLATRVDHSMPRDAATRRQVMQRIADLARMPLEAGKLGNLAVRRHPPAGNAPHR